MRWPFKLALGFIIAVLLLAVITSKDTEKPLNLASRAFTVTKYEYDQLQTGMTYNQAIHVIGEAGEESSKSEIAGIRTAMYMWKNWDGSNMNAIFQNDGLVSKAQFGLH